VIPERREERTPDWSSIAKALELGDSRRLLPPVNVVAEHDHEVERKRIPRLGHPCADVVLFGVSCAVVADDGELSESGSDGSADVSCAGRFGRRAETETRWP
jgi:hypothetical protein